MPFSSLPTIQQEKLFEQLQAGGLLLTVNNRLAKRFTADYNQWQLQQQKTIWESPLILPLSTWLMGQAEHLFDRAQAGFQVLNPIQEKQLWVDLIKPDAFDLYMMQPTAIAKQVIQAWQLLKQWQIPYSALSVFDTPETRALLKWVKKFEAHCQQHNWISQLLVIEKVSQAIEQQLCDLPEAIAFAGFEDPNRLQQQLIDSLASQNCSLSEFQHQPINQKIQQTVARDFLEELDLAANWAKQLLLESANKKISIVVPSLNENRQTVLHCFEQVLHPERMAPPPYQNKNLFNLTLGLPLLQYPLVQDAFNVLALLQPAFSLADLSKMLNASYLFKPTTEQNNSGADMAKIDLLLRDHGRQQWTLNALIKFLQTRQDDSAVLHNSPWLQQLEQIQQLCANCAARQSPEEWGKLFLALWKSLGWPGQRTLNSDEYQQSERLLKLLGEFRHLQRVKNDLSSMEAVSILKQMANETIFQVQSEDAPIQVSGLLEAADQQFDHLWLTSLDDQTLPAKSAPNPFIPLALQRQYDIPHSSVEREQAFASNMLRQFIHNASEVVFSHALREQDRDLRPSPLIHSLISDGHCIEPADFSGLNTAKQPNDDALQMEVYSDQQLPALPRQKTVRGGASILTQQAQCPFMANASFRLLATEPQAEFDGVSPLDRGNQLHLVLEKIWKQLQSQQHLLALPDDQLNQLLIQVIEDTLSIYRYRRPDLYQERFYTLEKQRLLKLVNNWLSVEKQRPVEFQVVEMEQDKTIEIGGLVLKTKADRVDRLSSGERIILDYKTGKTASSRSWLEQTITEPQLPLYSLFEQQDLAALALAKINEKQCQFNGLARQDKLLPGIKAFKLPEQLQPSQPPDKDADPWDLLLQHWQQQLTVLADAFRQGDSHIKPVNCDYCPYPALCRKHESVASTGDGEST